MPLHFVDMRKLLTLFLFCSVALSWGQPTSPGHVFLSAVVNQLQAAPANCTVAPPRDIYGICAAAPQTSFAAFQTAWEQAVIANAGLAAVAEVSDWVASSGSSDRLIVRKQYMLEGKLMSVFYDDGLPFNLNIAWSLPNNLIDPNPAPAAPNAQQFPEFQNATQSLIRGVRGIPMTCPDLLKNEMLVQRCAVTSLSLQEVQTGLEKIVRETPELRIPPDETWTTQVISGTTTAYLPIMVRGSLVITFVLEGDSRTLVFNLNPAYR